MQKLKINRIDFELAFELNSYETTADLDTTTGKVVFVEEYVTSLLDELLTDGETLDGILTALQTQLTIPR